MSETGGAERVAGLLRARNRGIPACAGNGAMVERSKAGTAGYPCVCGEQSIRGGVVELNGGSSLRGRGTGHSDATLTCLDRVIPACAGNRCRWFVHGPPVSGHPCVCGEQSYQTQSRGTATGSPACTGNRFWDFPSGGVGTGHPCVCGEQQILLVAIDTTAGPSLRVRGTGGPLLHAGTVGRVIPACAGNRAWARASPAPGSGHPCVCGEQDV